MISRVINPHPLVALQEQIGQVIVLRQHAIHKRVPRIQKIEHRPITLNEIDEEPHWLFEHRLPQLIAERRKSPTIDAVVLLEPAKVEPVAAELDRQPANPLIRQHPPHLSGEYDRLMKVASSSVFQ
jgi:hypothetical protein